MTENHFFSKLYFQRFDETNQRVGDTHNPFEKSEDEFFNDNVPRFIEHDKLHEIVAMFFRGCKETMFSRYLTNPTDIEMNEKLFKKAPLEDQVQCIIEEICVLLFERKIIPCIMKGVVIKDMNAHLQDIRAHFITNLCGNGHHWLRRWCLDHWNTPIGKTTEYKLDNLVQCVYTVLNKYPSKNGYDIINPNVVISHFINTLDDTFLIDKYNYFDTSMEKKFSFGVSKGHPINLVNSIVFDCNTRKKYQFKSVKLYVSLSKAICTAIESKIDYAFVIVDNIESPKSYITILQDKEHGFYYDGSNEYLGFIDNFDTNEGSGDITMNVFPIDKLKGVKFLIEVPESFNEKTLETFSANLYNSTVGCGYGGTGNLKLNRCGNPKILMELFEVFFIEETNYKSLAEDLEKQRIDCYY